MMSLRPALIGAVALLLLACGGSDQTEGPAPSPTPPPGGTTTPGTTPGTTTPGTTTPGTTTPGTPTDPGAPPPTDPGTPPPTDPGTPPPTNPGTPPPTSTSNFGHLHEGCVPELWHINVNSVQSTCADEWFVGGDVIQILFKDDKSVPTAGRIYTVVNQSQVNIYPADGEATAIFSPASGTVQGADSGTVTLDPVSVPGNISGTYQITLVSGSVLVGTFRSDTCPFEAGDCD